MAVVSCQAYGWFPTDGRGNPTGPQIGGDILVCVIRGGGSGRRGGGGARGLQNPRTPLSEKDINTARKNIRNMAKNPICNNFLMGVLEELGKLPQGIYSTNILKIFDAVRAQRGGGGIFSDKSQKGSLAYAIGSLESGNGIIAFGYTLDGGTGIHETIHLSAKRGIGHSHEAMAQAALTSASNMGIKVIGDLPNPNNYATAKAFDDANSYFFENIFFDACKKR